MTNLVCPGAVYTVPLNINNLGNIVGYYNYADSSFRQLQLHEFGW
jgi:hypothetical protein